MPGLDGQSLYQLASNQSADLARKMVFVTEDTANQSSKEFLTMTGNPVLNKPFDISEIRKLIDRIAQPTP